MYWFTANAMLSFPAKLGAYCSFMLLSNLFNVFSLTTHEYININCDAQDVACLPLVLKPIHWFLLNHL